MPVTYLQQEKIMVSHGMEQKNFVKVRVAFWLMFWTKKHKISSIKGHNKTIIPQTGGLEEMIYKR